ncbi:MAG: SprT family zinc-dependent metalloprotease [Verrucomicrobiota bacterium]
MKLDYEVVHANRKTIGITVERDRKVVVRVPQQANEQALSAVIESKRFWIWQKLRDPHKYPVPAPHKEYVTGETFLYLGQHCSLSLTRSQGGAVRLVGKQFEMASSDRRNGDALFRSWYLSQAKEQLHPRIATFATEMGVGYSRIWIRDLKYRWGSCAPGGTLSFNWRIIQAPMIVVDYLIVHELAHVLEPNHSQDFWNIVAVHVPSWTKARSWLKHHGSRLEW